MRVGLWVRRWGWGLALGCCGLGCAALAQESLAVPTQATSEEVYQWLQSDDPRMVAWGATFAAKNHDTSMAPYLARLAEEWVPLTTAYHEDGSGPMWTDEEKARVRAMSCVLDALIQMHGTVSPGAIQKLTANFTGQALTLFAYMPEPERRTFAESVYAERQVGAEYWPVSLVNERTRVPLLPGFDDIEHQSADGELIHVAAAILANDPPPGFVSSLLNETTMPLGIWVSDRGFSPPIAMSGGGTFLATPQPKGWPEQWTYVVKEKWPKQQEAKTVASVPNSSNVCPACCPPAYGELDAGEEVIVPGIPAITTQRAMFPADSDFEPFTSNVRLQLLHAMLGDTSRPRGGRLQESESVPFSNDGAFQVAVQQGVVKREQEFQTLSKELAAKGLMTTAEAQNAWPTLQVMVVDLRQAKTPPLPEIKLPPGLAKVDVVSADK